MADFLAFGYFLAIWFAFTRLVESSLGGRVTLSAAMNRHRADWIRTMARRDLRMIDTSIIAGLQNGTAFFASSSLIALGGVFALMGSPDKVAGIVGDITPGQEADAHLVEAKLIGLVAILAYAFFKFGWAYRLFNYCSILIGAVPMRDTFATGDDPALDRHVEQAARMNVLAGKHFNAGLRGVFFSIGYLGWFASPLIFALSTTFIAAVLTRRQFFSQARRAAAGEF
ncbi:MAG: DUF599 family protein [Notoacmeibacter sp.]|nr:DUF599 family protein [Notoacmeibacter sp.]